MHVRNGNKRNGLISQLGNVAANTDAKAFSIQIMMLPKALPHG
jgi:hypothetical protein